eukprot:jgi/Chrzof1/11894/Cz06g13250.t1
MQQTHADKLDTLCISDVPWRPASPHRPSQYWEGWCAADKYEQQETKWSCFVSLLPTIVGDYCVGEYHDYDHNKELAKLRSLKVDDYNTRRRLEKGWQKALKQILINPQ